MTGVFLLGINAIGCVIQMVNIKLIGIIILLIITPFTLGNSKTHLAEDILNGTFAGPGNYTFPDSLFIMAKLGIGMSAPTELLEIVGNIKLTGDILDGSGGMIFNSATGKILPGKLPYETGDITNDFTTNNYAISKYDVSQLSEGNVKFQVEFGRGLTGSFLGVECSLGDATTEDIKLNKKADINCDGNLETGTLELSGNANPNQVASGKIFYSNSFTQEIGTLEISTGPLCSGVVGYNWELINTFSDSYASLSGSVQCDENFVGQQAYKNYDAISCGLAQPLWIGSTTLSTTIGGGSSTQYLGRYKCVRSCNTDG